MLLKTKDGILCDWCGASMKRKFIYYSCEFAKVYVDADKKQTGPADVDKKYLNLDICEKCYKEIEDKCRTILKNAGEEISG